MSEERITFRVSKTERIRLEKFAHLENTTLSNYIKSKLFNEDEEQNNIKSSLEKYLLPILKTSMATHGFLDNFLKDKISEEQKEEILSDIKQRVDKIKNK